MMFRYACSTSSLDHSPDIFVAMTNSFALRIRPLHPCCAEPTSAFLTYCWVIVDPPCRSPPNRLFLTARAKPVNENPGFE
ncbi:Uncharacterised protein [Mycobacterium tuberculosis]|uniref:Uncharacterized protein n=1 Tax=Mycobacterium tuberculosis TaxID=1773 RepID=A0A0U0TKS8_MYCTX|nr:Uncharacterised protein [Mycobacterium tuberculosis]CFE67886.1 Uncharacterised protein [Mycobacterium tuberculosis]CFR85338.1 Uncharacterised protein [Mycobacterium tuberculosis]CFS31204.1 Uncharacterised protein [Mycobacterium tuberculosis]CKS42918.1 Uncharacterised protein [Mycobacterium tuberculosis]